MKLRFTMLHPILLSLVLYGLSLVVPAFEFVRLYDRGLRTWYGVALSMPTLAEAAPSEGCPIAKSIYRDGDSKGFELVFGAPPPNTPYYATAVIHHSQRRSIYRFIVSQSSGYGSVWLNEPSRGNSNQNNSFWITFFDQDLKSATPLWLGEEKEAPKYALIAELGSYDYSQRRGTENPPLIRDVMWIFDRCQS